MVSFEDEEDEEGGESLEELATDGVGQSANASFETLNNNHNHHRPSMVRLTSEDEARRLDICWRDVYEYDSNRGNDEKIYEDLCYITFSSSTLPEVLSNRENIDPIDVHFLSRCFFSVFYHFPLE